ncbi:DNRLRE domain-containing protein [Streptomyces sp. NPDC093071]|uniref:DNRLRE domain-containing protein n=1 Tax=Streptomyces sp. NPDC093071 TaxID=3366022 RepID=UPI003816F805
MSVALLNGASPATAEPTRKAAAPKKAAATQAADVASARVAARLSGKRVEALSERTETSTTWVNKDGSLTTELSAGPIRFKEATTGQWRDVDVTLDASPDGSVVSKAHPTGLRLAGKTGAKAASLRAAQSAPATDLVTLGQGDEAITLQWRGGLPAPKLDGTRATYVDAVPGADVVVEATRTGFEQFVDIRERPTGDYSYTLPLKTKGLKVEQQPDGSVLFTDRKSKKTAVMPAPVMWDATVDPVSGKHTRQINVAMKVVKAKGGVDLVLTPDAAFLADPATKYPVTVDPSTSSLSNVFDTYVQQGTTVDWSTDVELDLGNPGTKNADGTFRTARSFVSWNTAPIADALVTDAKLSLWNFHSGNYTGSACPNQPWEVWSTGAATTSSRWTAQPAWTAKKATSSETRGNASCTAQPDGWINADVTTMVQEWASAKAAKSHMGLRATDENNTGQWKRVNSANAASNPPKLTVTYNYRPRTGTKQEAGPPFFSYGGAYVVNTTTPTLRDTFVDPNGDKVNGTFQIFDNATDTQVGNVIVSPWAASGQTASVTVPAGVLANGKTYKFRTSPYDGAHYNLGWSAWKTFTVDTTNPVAPTGITSTDYPSTAWVKGAGQAGTFIVTPSGTDHNWLEWSLDGVTWTKVTTGGVAGAKSISVTPPKDGTHTLQVRAVDKADNKSEAISHTFHAGPGGFVQPADGETTARRVTLAAEGDGTKYNAVTFSWRRSEADPWASIPPGDVTSGGSPLSAWPVPLTGGRNGSLVWDAAKTVDPDGSIEIKADFTGPDSASGSTAAHTLVVDRNAQGAAGSRVGPGALNLLTGNYTLSESEASHFGLSVSRTHSSRVPDASAEQDGQVMIFGKEWSAGTTAEVTGSDYTHIRKISDTSVVVVSSNTDTIDFTANAARTGWIPEPGAPKMVLKGSVTGSFTLTDADGAVTSFNKLDAASPVWNVTSSVMTGNPNSETTTSSETVAVNGATLARPKRIVVENSAVPSSTCVATPSTKGCRVMEFVYATSTTATASSLGDYVGRVKEIRFWATEPGAAAATSKPVQAYAYDDAGRLRETWQPLVVPALKTSYTYDAQGRVITYTPAGRLPWTFTYGKAGDSVTAGEGMLLKASRPALKPGTADVVEGDAVTSVVYDVPLSGTTAPYDMSIGTIRTWGQTEAPTDATAVLAPGSVPASHTGSGLSAADYKRAAVTYMGVSGRAINTVAPGGHTGATETDRFGNIVRELTASNRSLALGLTAADKAAQAELGIAQLSSAERAELLSTRHVYTADGARKMEEFGPLRRVELTANLTSGTTTLVPAGTPVTARPWTVLTYDQGRPTDGTATVKDQVTRMTSGAQVREHPTVLGEARVTETVFDWVKGLPVKTVQDPSGLAKTSTTEYDSQGRVHKEILPGSTATDATTRVTTYWSATGTGPCAGRPEWADQLCSTGPGGAIVNGGTNPSQLPTTTTEYDWWGSIQKITETANGSTRTTTTTFDNAGRPSKTVMTGGVGTAVPEVTTEYDPANGQVSKMSSASGGAVSRTYDRLGRQLTYSDADGGVTTTTFDLLNRPVKVSDNVPSTLTFTYDETAEPRGLITGITDSVAGTFGASYDADGGVMSEKLPGGYTMTQRKDSAGAAISRTYTRDSDGTAVYTDQVEESVHGQVTAKAGWTDQSYAYDALGRLTTVLDTADSVCTRRAYAFDKHSNRTSLTTAAAAPGLDCPASGGTAKTYTYDTADRAVDAGFTYDAFGRTTTAPTHGTLGYYANDLVRQQTVGSQRQTWQLDPAMRFRSWTTETNSSGTWTQTSSRVNHYDSDSDSPRWIVENQATGELTRNVDTAGGGLGATTGKTGGTVLQLTNVHGDVALQLPLDTSVAPVALEYDEYGNPRAGQAGARYGWMGSQQRNSDTPSGLSLMGVRLYDPARGRFLQTDPVPGGSANAYDYGNADPCNTTDATGMYPNCGKRMVRNGYGMRIIVQRAGGGVNKSGYRYIRYYMNVQVMGWTNRYLAKNVSYIEVFGVLPGKRNRFQRLQAKGTWYNPVKIGWAVHVAVQVKPGSRLKTYGMVGVFGWNGYVADDNFSCMAKT